MLSSLAIVGAACTSGSEDDESEGGQSTTAPTLASAEVASTVDAGPLEIIFENDEVFCDGLNHPVAEIRGADPGERILLSSPLPVDPGDGVADDGGRYQLMWSCDQTEARLSWDLLAVGHDSGRRVEFTIVGTATDPEPARALTFDVPPEPVICDGSRQVIGTMTGADPFERIIFESPQTDDIRDGEATADGGLSVKWECRHDQTGTTWMVSARGLESGKSGQFTITGEGPAAGPETELAVAVQEDPFACNGESRDFAVLSNFTPLEVVDFSSDDAAGLIDGRADADGSLPIRWQCGRADIGKRWTLTASGVSSGRSTTITFAGGEPPDGTFKDLAATFIEDPFACNGDSRAFATIANFLPREFVDFSSPQSQALRQGQADENGSLAVRWQCFADDVDKTWDLTATGATSQKSITIKVTATAP